RCQRKSGFAVASRACDENRAVGSAVCAPQQAWPVASGPSGTRRSSSRIVKVCGSIHNRERLSRRGLQVANREIQKMRTRRAVAALVVGLAVSIAMRPDVAAAQSSPGNGAGPSGAAPLQEVVVTGTSIKGISAETALPVQVLKSEDVARTGATTAEELFEQISAASSSGLTNAAQATGFQTGAISS